MNANVVVSVLAAERKRRSLSIKDLSEQMGVSKSSISDWENGVRCPSLENACSWARALGFDLSVTRRRT